MDKRKAIVIAVVLFLLIGLGTFVFANPTQRGLEGDNTGNTTQGGSESVDDNTDGKEENSNEEQDEENDEPVISVIDDGNGNTGNGNSGNGNGGSSNNNNGNNNGGSTEEDNSAYLAALAALEKAEESFLQSDLDYANSLIDALQDNEDKSDLVNRANVVQEVIDVETLVKNLQNQVNTAQNIDNVNSARDYREDEEIVNKVTALENSSKKEELESILTTVAKILDDKEAPSISGIENGVVTSLDITLKVTDDNAVKVYVNGTETTFEDLQNMKFTEEKDYEVVVVDAAYNEAKLSFAKDVTAPEMFSLGITGFLAENDDAHYITYGKGFRVLLYVDEELATYPKLKFEGNDKEYVVNPADDNDPSINRYSYFLDVPASDVTKENFKEGEVKFKIYGYKDLAGNKGESLTNNDINSDIYDKVIIDNAAPVAAYLSYRVDGDAADGVETYYATNGDKLYISTAVNEELGANPIATFTDSEEKQFTSELEFTSINKSGQYIYTSYVEINPDLDVADGDLKVAVTNFKDKAGNKLEKTFTSSKVEIDRTFVKEVHLYALNLDKENHKLIRDNENLYLELVFDEEIVTNPIVKVGDGSEVSMACSWRDESQGWPARLYKCDATITIDGKSMNLTTNQNIPITIKNIKDAAGNETVLTEANLTNNDIKGYGQVVYDMTPPVHATLGITGYENENYDTHYITYGKGFRVALYFNEELSEVPKVKFDNFDKGYTAVVGEDTDASKNIYSYIIDIPAGDVNAENFSEGEIKFQVYGYKDLAGNEGEVLDNKDIKHPTQTKVVIDKTASADRWVYILNWNDSSYRTSISDGETLLVEATFNEPLQTMPTLEIGNSKFVFTDEEKLGVEDHYAYRVKVNINSSLGLEEGKEIPFKITNIVDLAGNKAESLDNNDVVHHKDKGYGQVVYENPIVSLTFHNATHYKENEDLGSNVSVTEASYGDTLRVFVRTSQDFALAYKPIININGFTK